jgi:hypothetical protein
MLWGFQWAVDPEKQAMDPEEDSYCRAADTSPS